MTSDDFSSTADWSAAGLRRIWAPYCQMKTADPPLPVVDAEGVRLHLADGRTLIDGISSWWTACHGYRHPYLVAAMTRQLQTLPHVMFGGLCHAPALQLAERLVDLAPGDLDRVFFCDSGSVAVEVSLKTAVQYWRNRVRPEKTRFVSFRHAYHGDTTGAMSVGDPVDGMHQLFGDVLPRQHCMKIPCGEEDWAALDALLTDDPTIAGVIIEPLVQGAGGMKFHDAEVVSRLRRLCDQRDALLIADEIAVGFGRTGTMFACEQAGVTPDLMCIGKSLTGGMISLAAVLASGRVFNAFFSDDPTHALMHGPTFMANPLACAAAAASIELFEREPRLAEAQRLESLFAEQLAPCRGMPGVVDVRARGAIGVVELADLRRLPWMRRRFVAEGVFLRPVGDAVYTAPAYNISEEDAIVVCQAIRRVVEQWSAEYEQDVAAGREPIEIVIGD